MNFYCQALSIAFRVDVFWFVLLRIIKINVVQLLLCIVVLTTVQGLFINY